MLSLKRERHLFTLWTYLWWVLCMVQPDKFVDIGMCVNAIPTRFDYVDVNTYCRLCWKHDIYHVVYRNSHNHDDEFEGYYGPKGYVPHKDLKLSPPIYKRPSPPSSKNNLPYKLLFTHGGRWKIFVDREKKSKNFLSKAKFFQIKKNIKNQNPKVKHCLEKSTRVYIGEGGQPIGPSFVGKLDVPWH